MERQNIAVRIAWVRLFPHRIAVRQRDRHPVVETPHAAQRAVVVIERAVFLHEYDNVLNVVDRASGVVGGRRQRIADQRGHHRRSRRCADRTGRET